MSLALRVFIAAILYCAFQIIVSTNWEAYSTIVGLRDYIPKERKLLNQIRKLEKKRFSELEELQKKIDSIEKEHEEALANVLGYLSNPINAYKLIKRLVIDWNEIHVFISESKSTKEYETFLDGYLKRINPPTAGNLSIAIDDLVGHDVDGALGSVAYGSEMTWQECYEIGVRLYDREEYNGAIIWLDVAMEKTAHLNEYNATRLDMIEYIAHSQHLIGYPEEAARTLMIGRELAVPNSGIEEQIAYFELFKDVQGQTFDSFDMPDFTSFAN